MSTPALGERKSNSTENNSKIPDMGAVMLLEIETKDKALRKLGCVVDTIIGKDGVVRGLKLRKLVCNVEDLYLRIGLNVVRLRNYLVCSRVLHPQVLAIFYNIHHFLQNHHSPRGPFIHPFLIFVKWQIVARLPFFTICAIFVNLLTIIPQAQMGSESIAHEAEGYK